MSGDAKTAKAAPVHSGSCHCGAVAFEVEGDIAAVIACNCSICQRKGALLWAAPRDRFRLRNGAHELASYTFAKRSIVHRFCKICGIHPFAEDAALEGEPSVYINVRCLSDIDLPTLTVIDFDGRSA